MTGTPTSPEEREDQAAPHRETIIPVDENADDLLRPTPGPVYPPDPPTPPEE